MADVTGTILFLIPARGGSKRVPGKNLRLVGGIPLVGLAIRVAVAAAEASPGGPHRIVCSTDHPDIARVARIWGATVVDRPPELATDDTATIDVAFHAIGTLEPPPATVVLIQPTSPLTDPEDVAAAIRRHREHDVSIISVSATHAASWHFQSDDDGALLRSTALDDHSVLPTGAFYVATPGDLRRVGAFVESGRTVGALVPAARSIDVDTETDLIAAESFLAARTVRAVPVGDRVIGDEPIFVIAEAGVNHNGDPTLARRLIDAASEAGADAVKFQTFEPSALAAETAPMAAYQRQAADDDTSQRTMLDRLMLPAAEWAELSAYARSRGLIFLSTPFDDGSAALLASIGVPAFKIGSGELTNIPFIGRVASFGRPMLMSTGMADMVEVAAAVDRVRASGDVPVALLHCVSSYPAAPEDANLRAMETMRRAFGVPVGWSDHTPGDTIAIAAVALGAALIEKHLTLDRRMSGPDHAASLEPAAFRAMVEAIRATEGSLGSGIKMPVPAEQDVASVARRSLHWHSDRDAGQIVDATDLDVLRPGNGLAPNRLVDVIGRRLARPVRGGTAVDPDDVDGLA